MGGKSIANRNACAGKGVFASRKEARAVATKMRKQRQHEPSAQKVQAYRCSACGFYHIGRPAKAKHRALNKGE